MMTHVRPLSTNFGEGQTLYHNHQRYEDALRIAAEADDEFPDGFGLRLHAHLLVVLGHYREALPVIERARQQSPESTSVRLWLAEVLVNGPSDLRDLPQALELAEEAHRKRLKSKRDDAKLSAITLGVVHFRLGNYSEARKLLPTVLEKNQRNEVSKIAQFVLAMSHWQLGEKEKAREVYQQAADWFAEHHPNFPRLARLQDEAAALLEIEPTANRDN